MTVSCVYISIQWHLCVGISTEVDKQCSDPSLAANVGGDVMEDTGTETPPSRVRRCRNQGRPKYRQRRVLATYSTHLLASTTTISTTPNSVPYCTTIL